ncbi:histidine phosphotransferase ChpT [Caulobacter sp. S45]|jgi:histidine phosphotransferase ChpT|uniref:histidine phosphotransferase ChpT n=1 Tax=Caulobacter sp. S45 TaxID=1641861 RepID=UPI00131AA438|nr:histidine phosphotransferase family protein [Caulobacter sp. S45]
MTDPMPETDYAPSSAPTWDDPLTPPAEPVTAGELAAQLSARLCHDFVSPASAIVSGLDLLEDPTAADMREDAMNLINTSARKLVDMLAFARVAFGASASAETFDVRELEKLARGVFAHVRPQMEWSTPMAGLNKTAARALLNLAQIGAGALPTGGLARISATIQDNDVLLWVEAVGPRARLRPEVTTGLRGEKLEGGLGGHWVQAYYLHLLLKAAGGRVDFAVAEERVTLRARVAAD